MSKETMLDVVPTGCKVTAASCRQCMKGTTCRPATTLDSCPSNAPGLLRQAREALIDLHSDASDREEKAAAMKTKIFDVVGNIDRALERSS